MKIVSVTKDAIQLGLETTLLGGSDFAVTLTYAEVVAMYKAMSAEAGKLSSARQWARRIMMSSRSFTAPNGDIFKAKNLPIGGGPFWGTRGFECSINGIDCDAPAFEERLSAYYPNAPLGLLEMIEQARDKPYQQHVLIGGHPHTLRVEVRGGLFYYLDGVDVPVEDFERYLGSSSLPNAIVDGNSVG